MKMVLKRELIEEYNGVVFHPQALAQAYEQEEYSDCVVYSFGGYRFHIPKGIEDGSIIKIRKMKKFWKREGEEEEMHRKVYYVFEVQPDVEPQWHLYLLQETWKYTLSGVGRDRYYREHLEPVDGSEEVYVQELCSSSWAYRSGRAGAVYRLVLADRPCRVLGEDL